MYEYKVENIKFRDAENEMNKLAKADLRSYRLSQQNRKN